MSLKFCFSTFVTVLVTASLGGCASLARLVKGSDDPAPKKDSSATKFSDNDSVRVNSDRQYKRMTRQKFEEDADLKEDAGSLWVMEGQGAYLFSQNQMRTVGDLLNVKIEGGPKAQLQTKSRVIAKLLERLEAPAVRGLAAAGAPGQPGAAPAAGAAPPAAGAPAPAAPAADGAAPAAGAEKKDDTPFAVQVVPTRIVEQLKDGSYRVRGQQPFMIGKREYKVIVTGVVRPEDFDDAGIEAGRLLDPQFDIVSSKKGSATL